jgi:hypothetical protein
VFIGSGRNNNVYSSFSSIVGGSSNAIEPVTLSLEGNSFVGGGRSNRISSRFVSIVGGEENSVLGSSDWSSIGGGFNNTITDGTFSVLGGGSENTITDGTFSVLGGGSRNSGRGRWLFLGGGWRNTIGLVNANLDLGIIVGGNLNSIEATGGTIVGGQINQIETGANWSFIGAGEYNAVESVYASIVGGTQNLISGLSERSFIGGGQQNTIQSMQSSIAGGYINRIGVASIRSFIGGGYSNSIASNHAAVVGGESNSIETASSHSFIGAGQLNSVKAPYGSIVGGMSNGVMTSGMYSFVGGGVNNYVIEPYSVVVGGRRNATAGSLSAVVGGEDNVTSGALSFIGSGKFNLTIDSFSVVVGGLRNFAELPYDAVVGGLNNRANGSYSFVGGGFFNQVDPDINVASRFSSILGGAHNDIRGRYSAIMGGHGLRLGEGQVGFRRPRNPLTVAQEATDSWVGRDDGAIFVNTHMTLANDGATVQSQLRLYEQRANGQEYVGIRAPTAVANNVVFTLPGTTGTAGQVLTTDGTGNLSWAAASASAPTGVSFAVIGADYVVDADDQVLIYAANAANANITLPPTATSAGRQIHVINMAGGGNVTFVDAANAAVPVRMYRFNGGWITSSTLSGTVNLAANQGLGGSIGNSVTILCDGFFWYAIAR